MQAGTQARRALDELAQMYWFPLYAYSRQQGKTADEAEDLTQTFFARLIEKNTLRDVRQEKGRFRSFLLTSFKNFVINEYKKTQALKRGGGRVVYLDAMDAEHRYQQEPVTDHSPERVYEQRWAWTVLDQVMLRLRAQYEKRGQGALFDAIKGSLQGPSDSENNAIIANHLGVTVGAIGVAMHRLRQRYRDMICEEIAQTVADPSLIDDELRYLFSRL